MGYLYIIVLIVILYAIKLFCTQHKKADRCAMLWSPNLSLRDNIMISLFHWKSSLCLSWYYGIHFILLDFYAIIKSQHFPPQNFHLPLFVRNMHDGSYSKESIICWLILLVILSILEDYIESLRVVVIYCWWLFHLGSLLVLLFFLIYFLYLVQFYFIRCNCISYVVAIEV